MNSGIQALAMARPPGQRGLRRGWRAGARCPTRGALPRRDPPIARAGGGQGQIRIAASRFAIPKLAKASRHSDPSTPIHLPRSIYPDPALLATALLLNLWPGIRPSLEFTDVTESEAGGGAAQP